MNIIIIINTFFTIFFTQIFVHFNVHRKKKERDIMIK